MTAKRQELDRCALLIASRKGEIVDALTVKWTEKGKGPMKTANRRTLTLLSCMIFTAVDILVVPLANANSCSQASAAGRWAFTATGSVILPTGASLPVTQVGSFGEDIQGNVSGSQTRSLGGSVDNETFAGTASINPDCTGSAALAVYDEKSGALVRTTTVSFVLDDDGNHARSMVTSVVLPDGTSLAPLLTLDYRRIFFKRSN